MVAESPSVIWRPQVVNIVWAYSNHERFGDINVLPPMSKLDWAETERYVNDLFKTTLTASLKPPPNAGEMWHDCIDLIAKLEVIMEDSGLFTFEREGVGMTEPIDARKHLERLTD